MHEPPQNLDEDWRGLEPEQPRLSPSMKMIFGIGAAVFLGLAVCLTAAYFAWAQFRARTATGVPPAAALPTAAAMETAVSPTVTLPPTAPTATLPATPTASESQDGSIEAGGLAVPPLVDGVLTEWTGVATVTSPYRVYSVAGWDGTDDLSAVWQLAWDNAHLYVAVTVTDDVHVQTAVGNQIFRGDGVDLQFDTDREADYGSGLSPDDIQITLSPGDFGGNSPAAFRYQGTTLGAIVDAPGGHSVTVAARPTATGYTLEAAIPWTDLNLAPAPGLTLGLALNANDNDTPGTAVQEVMKSNMPFRSLTNPTTWGTLTLK